MMKKMGKGGRMPMMPGMGGRNARRLAARHVSPALKFNQRL